MSILVVGSVAYDSVKTPCGSRQSSLGGAATYFSVSASYFAPVSVIAVVGDDFRPEDQAIFDTHGIDTQGIARISGETFRWVGEYGNDFNEAHTLETHLNVFAGFTPELGSIERKFPFLFLANIDPELQYKVLQQMEKRPKLVAGDTMNFWIEGKPQALSRVINDLDILIINEGEVRQLSNEPNIVTAAQHLLDLGPSMVIAKRGEYGSISFDSSSVFVAPAYPLETVVDPTGAGDTFAGGVIGYLAASGKQDNDSFRRAMVVGSVMASFTVESFGLERLASLTPMDIQERYRELWSLTYFHSSSELGVPIRPSGVTKPVERRRD
ncbi:PfkB family carbohydrate kinase [Dehalococcoidia bacterium]|nr:PfkB family carbohydrate kinase [Dehalococcoidia bacterium]